MRTWMWVAALAATAALAQPGPQGRPGGGMPMKPDYAKALAISPEEAAQVEAILAAEREQHRAAHEKAHADLARVLTAQQLETLEQMMPRGPRGGAHGAGPAGDRVGPPPDRGGPR